jgi:hypothetical protein
MRFVAVMIACVFARLAPGAMPHLLRPSNRTTRQVTAP